MCHIYVGFRPEIMLLSSRQKETDKIHTNHRNLKGEHKLMKKAGLMVVDEILILVMIFRAMFSGK